MQIYHGANGDIYLFEQGDSNYLTQHNTDLTTIIDHDHTNNPIHGTNAIIAGSIGTASIADGSITSAKLASLTSEAVIANNTYKKWRNAANNADLNVIKVNASDQLEFEQDIGKIRFNNNITINGETSGGANHNLFKVNTSDQWELLNTVYAQTVNPKTNSTYDLGTSSLYWNRAYLNNLRFSSSGAYDMDYFKYEQNWSLTVNGGTSSGTGTYASNAGGYVRIGKFCWFWGRVRTTAHTGTGDIRVVLPYTAAAYTGDARSGWVHTYHDTTEGMGWYALIAASGTYFTLGVNRSGGSSNLSIAAAMNFSFNFMYEVA